MKISKNSWWIRWAYLDEIVLNQSRGIPYNTDLCCIFWRSVLWIPIFLFAAIFPAILLGVIVGVLTLVAWLASMFPDDAARRIGRILNTPVDDLPPVVVLRDWKQKTCTLVEITRD